MWVKYYQLLSQLKELFFDFFSSWPMRIYAMALFCLNILLWLIAVKAVMASGRQLTILHYNIDFGVNLVGEAKKILVIPLLGLLVALINLVLAFVVYQVNVFLRHLLLAGAVMVNFLLLAALAAIYFVNFHSWF